MFKPEVSVIVPIYNASLYFSHTIASITNQSFNKNEIILIDDGSTDYSAELCDELCYAEFDQRVVVIHKPNAGVSAARNSGIDCAIGRYVVFVDSDDRIDCNYLSAFITASVIYPNYKNIWCGFKTSIKEKWANGTVFVYDNLEKYSLIKRSDYISLGQRWLTQTPWNKLFLTEILNRNSIRMRNDLSLGEDVVFNLEYIDAANTDILIVNSPLYFYDNSSELSLGRKYRNDLLETQQKIRNAMLPFLIKWGISKSDMCIYYNQLFYDYEKVFDGILYGDNQFTFIQKILKILKITFSFEYWNAVMRSGKRSTVFKKLALSALKRRNKI